MQGRGSVAGVDVEPEIDQQPDRLRSSQLGGSGDEVVPSLPNLDEEIGVGGEGLVHGSAIGREAGADESGERFDRRRVGARGGEHVGDLEVAVEDGALVRTPAVVGGVSARLVGVDAPVQQQARPLLEPGLGGVLQRLGGDLDRRLVGMTEATAPWTTITSSQTELEEELEELGVVTGDVAPSAVVDGLTVVRLRAGLQQQAGESQLLAVRRRSLLAASEGPGERGER